MRGLICWLIGHKWGAWHHSALDPLEDLRHCRRCRKREFQFCNHSMKIGTKVEIRLPQKWVIS